MSNTIYSHKRNRRIIRILFIIVSLLFFISSRSYAAPDTNDTANTTWVDISATVPEGFRGDVTVQLLRLEDETYHKVTAHYIGDYKNSVELPIGTYSVERAFTSENSLSFEAFIDLDEIVLAPGDEDQFLLVEVKHNPAGDITIPLDPDTEQNPPSDEVPGTDQDTPPDNDPEAVPDSDTPSTGEDDPEQQPSESEPNQNPDKDTSQEESKPTFKSVLKRAGITLAGTGIFILLILGIAYLIRRHYYAD